MVGSSSCRLLCFILDMIIHILSRAACDAGKLPHGRWLGVEGSDEEGGDATGSLQAFSRPAAGPVASPGRGQRKTDPFRDPFTGLGPRRLSALSAFDSKLVWYGACAWARTTRA